MTCKCSAEMGRGQTSNPLWVRDKAEPRGQQRSSAGGRSLVIPQVASANYHEYGRTTAAGGVRVSPTTAPPIVFGRRESMDTDQASLSWEWSRFLVPALLRHSTRIPQCPTRPATALRRPIGWRSSRSGRRGRRRRTPWCRDDRRPTERESGTRGQGWPTIRSGGVSIRIASLPVRPNAATDAAGVSPSRARVPPGRPDDGQIIP
jgi:hypothetical protein